MRVLIIKTSSLGDVIHTLPALTDAGKYIKNIQFDWAVEPAFAEIPRFHPLVKNIIPTPLRTFRKNFFKVLKNKELQSFCENLNHEKYDRVIDAQGLIKSGMVTFLSKGIKCGYDKNSAWEPLACFAYHKKFAVDPNLHAITRIRQLFAKALDYKDISELETPDYGIAENFINHIPQEKKNIVVFLHGTTRDDKRFPLEHWNQLRDKLINHDKNLKILLPFGNDFEKQCAEKIAENQDSHQVNILPKSNLTQLAQYIFHSKLIIAVDTGLGHLSAALNQPTLSLYGPTDPKLIGTVGENQIHLKSSSLSMKDISPTEVFKLALLFL